MANRSFIQRWFEIQDGAKDTVGSKTGRTIATSLGSSDIIYLEDASFGSLQLLGSVAGQTLTFYGCNDPDGTNNTFVLLYDETGAAVTLTTTSNNGIYAIPPAAMCCKAIKIVAGSNQVMAVVGTKG